MKEKSFVDPNGYSLCERCFKKCHNMGIAMRVAIYGDLDDRILCYECMMELYEDRNKSKNIHMPPYHPMCK